MQWRIQDFPEEGAPTYDFAKFSQKLHEIERIWTPRGRFLAPALDPPLIRYVHWTFVSMNSTIETFIEFSSYPHTVTLVSEVLFSSRNLVSHSPIVVFRVLSHFTTTMRFYRLQTKFGAR